MQPIRPLNAANIVPGLVDLIINPACIVAVLFVRKAVSIVAGLFVHNADASKVSGLSVLVCMHIDKIDKITMFVFNHVNAGV